MVGFLVSSLFLIPFFGIAEAKDIECGGTFIGGNIDCEEEPAKGDILTDAQGCIGDVVRIVAGTAMEIHMIEDCEGIGLGPVWEASTTRTVGYVVVPPTPDDDDDDDICLIATAAYGSALAPEVQMLREIRDNKLMQTESGTTFMTFFNTYYYTFSPTIASWEQQNPMFKEIVRATITPLITSLSLLQYVDMDSEAEVLGYGISMILLNIGMYFVAPTILIVKLRDRFSR